MNAISGTHARDAAVLAMTLHAEPRSRSVRALEALAAMIMNRVAAKLPHWGDNAEAVCRAPFQFPCWNPRHPSHAALRADPEDLRLAICRRIAARAISGVLPDPTGGATHHHGDDAQPSWAMTQVPVAEIGGLVFYRIEPATRPVALSHLALAACR